MLQKGDVVGELSWTTSEGAAWSLEGLHPSKAVVFFFYPGDFTPGCTKEVCFFRDAFDELKAQGAALFGVSLDDEASHEHFREKYKLPYPLIADKDKRLSRAFGVLRLGGLLKVRRATFVVDPRTKEIIEAFSSEFNMQLHAQRALATIQGMSSQASTGGEG